MHGPRSDAEDSFVQRDDWASVDILRACDEDSVSSYATVGSEDSQQLGETVHAARELPWQEDLDWGSPVFSDDARESALLGPCRVAGCGRVRYGPRAEKCSAHRHARPSRPDSLRRAELYYSMGSTTPAEYMESRTRMLCVSCKRRRRHAAGGLCRACALEDDASR